MARLKFSILDNKLGLKMSLFMQWFSESRRILDPCTYVNTGWCTLRKLFGLKHKILNLHLASVITDTEEQRKHSLDLDMQMK